MSNGYLLADTNSLVYAYRAGGTDLLDLYFDVAGEQDRKLAITETVSKEIKDGPLRKELLQYIDDKQIPVLSAPETELKLRTGQIPSRSAGEVSMLEVAAQETAAGHSTRIWSDDKYFASQQIMRSAPGAEPITSAGLLNETLDQEFIDRAKFHAYRSGYEAQADFRPGHSQRLNTFYTLSPDGPAPPALTQTPYTSRSTIAEAADTALTSELNQANTLRTRGRVIGASGAVVLGAAVEAYQWNETLGNANTFRNTLGNDTAANEALARQAASSTSGIVGGVVGTSAAATLGLGTGGTFALVAADAYFFSAAADKAVTLWQQDKIYQQTSDGVKWELKGKDWVREDLRADFVRDGVDNPKQQPIAASFDKARELSYLASVEAVEQQLGKVPAPRNPFEQPAAAGDAYSARPSPWTYSTESAQWSRQLVTQEGDGTVRAVYKDEIATGERPAQLSGQALRTIDANLASGPAAIAAQYEVGYTQRGYQHQGKLPASIEVALDPNLLQASDGKHYRRDEQGQWTHEGEKASAQRALELTITHYRLAPALQQHEQAMSQIPPWQRPTQQQLDIQTLQDIYVRHHVKPPEGEQLDAAYAAVLRTRNEQGLPAERLSLTLEADANGQFSQRSTIQHLQKDADGVLRVAAVTTASEIDAIQKQPSPGTKFGQPESKSDSEQTPNIEAPKPLKNEHAESTPHFGSPIASRSDDKEVVGLTTGLQVANDFRDKNHPGNPRYQQMLHEVERMETTNGIAHGPNTSLMAAALAIKAEQSKFDMSSIVKLEPGGQVSAMKLDPYAPPTKVSVDPKAVIAQGQSFEKSTEQWSQARSQHYASNAPAAERTQEQVKALSQLSPADQAIFEKIRQNVPPQINDEVVARATLQAKQVGVSNVEQIDMVAMAGNSIAVKCRTPGMRSTTDTTEPTTPMPETAKQTETFNQQIAIDQRLAREQAYAKQQEQSGPGLGVQMSGGMAGAPRGQAQG